MNVIARYSYVRLLAGFVPMWGLAGVAALLAANAFEKSAWPGFLAWCLAVLFFLGLSVLGSAGVLWSRGRAMWIEDGRLFTPYWSLPVNEIRKVLLKRVAMPAPGFWGGWHAGRTGSIVLAINRAEGETEKVEMDMVREPVELIAQRLQAALGLLAAIDTGVLDRPARRRLPWLWLRLAGFLGLAICLALAAIDAWEAGKTAHAILWALAIPGAAWTFMQP